MSGRQVGEDRQHLLPRGEHGAGRCGTETQQGELEHQVIQLEHTIAWLRRQNAG